MSEKIPKTNTQTWEKNPARGTWGPTVRLRVNLVKSVNFPDKDNGSWPGYETYPRKSVSAGVEVILNVDTCY